MQKHFIVFMENRPTILNEVDGLDTNLNVLMSVKERWVILFIFWNYQFCNNLILIVLVRSIKRICKKT